MSDVALKVVDLCPITAEMVSLYAINGYRLSYLTLNQKTELISLCAHLLRNGRDFSSSPVLESLGTDVIRWVLDRADNKGLLTRIIRCTAVVVDEERYERAPSIAA